MLTTIVVLVTVGTGLWIGFAARPSGRWVLALAGGAVLVFIAAHVFYDPITFVAYALALSAPVAAVRMAATKWSTPDIYDDE